MKSFLCIAALFALLTPLGADAQQVADSTGRIVVVTVRGGYGKIFNTNDFLDGLNADGVALRRYASESVCVGVQTTGSHLWEHEHNFPQFGAGLYAAPFDHPSDLGRPVSLYGFYKAPIRRFGQSAVNYKVELGMAFNWTPYDAETNPYNITIGSKATVHLSLGLEYVCTLARRWQLGAGVELTHFSNGAMRKPNKGLNLATPYLAVSYLFGPMPDFRRRTDIVRRRGHEAFVALGGGMKRSELEGEQADRAESEGKSVYNDVRYGVGTLTGGYLRQYGNKGKFGGGLSLVYDDWLGSSLTVSENGGYRKHLGPFGKRMTLGLFAAHELCIDRLSILTHLGCYVAKSGSIEQSKPSVFERAGVKYHFKCNTFVGVNIYAHKFSKADFIEWNVGQRIPW